MPTTAPATPRPIPGRIGGVLRVLATLIAHARAFTVTAARHAAAPEFSAVAAVFGTFEAPVILHHVQRGLLRALALRQYLLERAARGRNLRFAWQPLPPAEPRHRPRRTQPASPTDVPPPAPRRKTAPDPVLLSPDHPGAFRMPRQQELEAQVRRRPIGRTITYICLDLGIIPGLCNGAFWNRIDRLLHQYGGSLNRLYEVRAARRTRFLCERDRRPETWHIDWQDMRHSAVLTLLGGLIGETPPDYPPLCLPVIVPS